MPSTKRGGKRGNSGAGRTRGGRRNPGLDTSFVPFSNTAAPRRDHNGFTLQDEARNTERHHSFWNTDQRLRDSQVTFVSAGTLDSTKPKDTEAALAEMTLDSPKDFDKIEVFEEEEENEHVEDTMMSSDHRPIQQHDKSPLEDSKFNYIVDVHGSEPVQTGIPPPRLRSVSPVPSNSSEEIILYAGRDRQGRGISRVSSAPRTVADPIEQKIRRVEDEIHKREEMLEEVLRHGATPPVLPNMASSSSIKDVRPKHQRRGRRNHSRSEDSEEAALIADYIANIDKDDRVPKSFAQRELGGTEDEVWQDTEASSGEPIQKSESVLHGDWDRADICDFDDLSTSDGVMGDVQQILSKRDRESGVQYLVVWQDQTVDEARWVPTTTLTSVNALSHIETFEAEEKLVAEFTGATEEDSGDSDDLDIDDEDGDDLADDEDLLLQKIERMSDEKIARLLAKQEELGMGSSKLILFDDDDEDDGDDDDDIPTFSNTFSPVMLSSKKSAGRGRGSKRPKGEFPSATMMADAFDGFDVMDFDRPSLKKRPKGRKGKFVPAISDSELEASMEMAWENDRLKKKDRKQEREELRAQGLLGSKSGKPDLKQKYKEGMDLLAVREEIKKFLMGNNITLSLPPMDKANRKAVHELAIALQLKSKSAGNGTTRFPILYKTARTTAFAEHAYNAAEARLTRRYLPRMDVSSRSSGVKRARGGGFNSGAVSYRDGDIVGGSAPELGAGNRGRAMLEKMGWSSGTALGALNNKGILQPVSHVVKTTKAGLG
ncbi:uncharacterized protein LY89DRAFT_739596 [Mollisia scopiformis]|uniref:Protein SQS1 n=1 Tax=Mollisia scopiformis TaxID=149040 RepID=A0A194WSK1_MOLSC|nr:uncharacterized protein LY89DRAFT_739596 [Mollisia scopiformis]KUJ10592.1 hypothetical protein LY89DRAFT_739596 [Mollisia scopiformis]